MFFSKADTLAYLKDKITKSRIEDLLIVTGNAFFQREADILDEIGSHFRGQKIVVRSSSSNEDSFETSNAGHYDSILNVQASDENAVKKAIQDVFSSYRKDIDNMEEEQVLIQRQTEEKLHAAALFFPEILNWTARTMRFLMMKLRQTR